MSEYKRPVSFRPGKVHITDDMTIPWLFRKIAAESPDHVVINVKSEYGQWAPITWSMFAEDIRAVARGLVAQGVHPGERIAIMCHTRYEFSLLDLACWSVGAMLVPIYETDPTDEARFIINDSHLEMAFVEDQNMYSTLAPMLEDVDFFQHIEVINDDALTRIKAAGSEEQDAEIDRRIAAMKADDLATVIYTSGTTGRPKGVMISHRNMLQEVFNGPLDTDLGNVVDTGHTRTLLFLPMAHVFARFINLVSIYTGAVVGYTSNARTLINDMQTFKPTYVLAVPRVFEKIYNAADAQNTGWKQKLFRYYAKVAIRYSQALDTKEGPSPALKAAHAAGEALVYSKIQSLFGGNLTYCVSGGGPLGQRLGHFFRGAGITVLEGYGASETCAPATVNLTAEQHIGSVGPAYPGTWVGIAEDGEVLVKGDSVTTGYLNDPEATRAAFTEDGWFKTGDLGRLDEDGYLWITGRKKEIIVTAGGKNVAPAPLEDRLRGHPLISQVVVVGDKRPFIGALVTLDADMLPVWLKNKGIEPMSVDEARQDPRVLAALDRAVNYTNQIVSRAESIRKIVILPVDFTVENGYLTPSLKVKRNLVLRDFADVIDNDIYGEKKSSLQEK